MLCFCQTSPHKNQKKMQNSAPTRRFTNRVDNYVKYRPSYNLAMMSLITETLGYDCNTATVADIGSGTGISSKLFLEHGFKHVIGVEPNDAMRTAAEKDLQNTNFVSVNGTAEHTTLADKSVDLIVAGQAFHWFDRLATRSEFIRILNPNNSKSCNVILFWNDRKYRTEFGKQYEALMHQYCKEMATVSHKNLTSAQFAEFFGGSDKYHIVEYPNNLEYTWEQLLGRTMSSSYAPVPSDAHYESCVNALKALFDQHKSDIGTIVMEYDTSLYYGKLM